jgi:hypothetical protein
MATGKHGSGDVSVFLIGGYDFLANKPTGVSRKVDERLQRCDGLGDSWQSYCHTGVSAGTFAQSGAIFDDTTNQMHTALKTSSATSRVGLIAWGGNVLGGPCTGFAGLLTTGYEVLAQLAGLTKANATYSVNGQVEEGVILQPLAALTSTTTGTGVDNGAASTNGGAAYLEVTALSGFTSIAVKLQDSTDNSSWSDISGGAFTAVTSAPGAQRIAISGTIRRYVRSVITPTGSGSVTAIVALARG